jgi:hypothetical protein
MSRRNQVSVEDFNQVLGVQQQPVPAQDISTQQNMTGDPFLDGAVDFDSIGEEPRPMAGDLFEDVTPGTFPEMKEEVNLTAEIQSSLENLQTVLEDIKRAGGMSHAIALECHSVVPGFDIPVNRFTKHPTKTQYSASLESIADSIISACVRAFKYIRQAILKVLYWMVGKEYKPENPHTSEQSTLDEIQPLPQEVTSAVLEKLKESSQDIAEAKGVLSDIHYQVQNFEQIAATSGIEYKDAAGNMEWYKDPEKYIKDMNYANGNETEQKVFEFMTKGDRVHSDLATNGQFVQLFTEVERLMDEAAQHNQQVLQTYQTERSIEPLQPLLTKGEQIIEKAKSIEEEAMNRDFSKSSVGTRRLAELMKPFDRVQPLTADGVGKCASLVQSLSSFNEIAKTGQELATKYSQSNGITADGTEDLRAQIQATNAVIRDSMSIVKVIGAFFRVTNETARSARNYSNVLSFLVNNIANKSIPGKDERSLDNLKRMQEAAKVIRQDLTKYSIIMGKVMNARAV